MGWAGSLIDDPIDARGDRVVADPQWALDAKYSGKLQEVGVPFALRWVGESPPSGSFAALSAGRTSLCGLRPDRSVACWGEPEASPTGPYAAISGGCGIRPGGELACWDPALMLAPAGSFTELAVGDGRACALAATGRIDCWGSANDSDAEAAPPGEFTALAIGAGYDAASAWDPRWTDGTFYDHTCTVRAEGTIACWGSDEYGQSTPPPPHVDAAPYTAVAAGVEHTCALSAAGEVLCWGHNLYGQTNAPPGPFAAIAAGAWHTCALRPAGHAECWGDGHAGPLQGQFLDPPPTAATEPPPGPYTAIAAGAWHTCALRPTGEVSCWYSY